MNRCVRFIAAFFKKTPEDISGKETISYSGPQTPKLGGFESGLPEFGKPHYVYWKNGIISMKGDLQPVWPRKHLNLSIHLSTVVDRLITVC